MIIAVVKSQYGGRGMPAATTVHKFQDEEGFKSWVTNNPKLDYQAYLAEPLEVSMEVKVSVKKKLGNQNVG